METIESILEWFKKSVEDHHPVSAGLWIEGAQKLIALLGNLDEDLVDAEIKYREERAFWIEKGKSAAEAEARAKCTDAYRSYLKLKAKRERAEHFINITKARTRLQAFDQ